jgi:hypothetical protein
VVKFESESDSKALSRELLPIFRGLRVRMGVHTGVADVVKLHESTRRVIYGGEVRSERSGIVDVVAVQL